MEKSDENMRNGAAEGEILRLREQVDALQRTVSRFARIEQELKNARQKIDMQAEKFAIIKKYAVVSFDVRTEEFLVQGISEGVVDIFQLEIGALFALDFASSSLVLRASCNLDDDDLPPRVPFPPGWLENHGLWLFRGHRAIAQSPVTDPLWQSLGLASVVFMPMFNNDLQLAMIAMGGVTTRHSAMYEFHEREIVSPFMVYCQLMGGILNNIHATQRAYGASRAKSRFLANLSHEIRTPMNAIIGMTQIAQRTDDREKIADCVRQIDTSSRHLLSLINDVLDISKIEEGQLSLDKSPFDLKHVVDDAVSAVSYQSGVKKQNLVLNYHGMSDFRMTGDGVRLQQVLINLLSNAVKFTPEGGSVTLDVLELSREPERVYVKFTVTDTGIGISREFQENLFSPFQQEDRDIARKYGGTGLGLAISQQIIGLMGGKIAVSSERGQGAAFTFSVWFEEPIDTESVLEKYRGAGAPQAPAVPERTAPAERRTDFSGYNVLVADDIAINRDIIETLISGSGVNVEGASDGREAAEMFFASSPGYYALIFMDMQMPIMDGVTATRLIRASDHPDAARVAIVAMTANVFKEDVEAVLASGMNGHIGKPVEYETLMNTLDKYL